jgi:DNA-3-methyladenine glycosylase II
VRVAFPADGTFEIVGAKIEASAPDAQGCVKRVDVMLSGAKNPERVKQQIARALGLDHDGRAFMKVVNDDPVLAKIAARRPGFRPVVAYSPYVMAAWCILSQRLRMPLAAKLQVKMAEAFGDSVVVDGQRVASFPKPTSILAAKEFPGIAAEKWNRLRGVAEAALRGELEVDRLLSVPYDFAHARLTALRGIGTWTADATLIRGAGPTDALPISEPRLGAAIGHAYGLGRPATTTEILSITESWRPFRTWVSVLLVSDDWTRASLASGRQRGRRLAA